MGCRPTKESANGEEEARLNENNLRTKRGNPWTARRVESFCHRRGIRLIDLRTSYSLREVLAWADAFHKRAGHWPKVNSGPIEEVPGKTWWDLNDALRRGHWGLPAGRSLAVILQDERGVRNHSHVPPLTEEIILRWAREHLKRTGNLPRRDSGPVLDTKLYSQSFPSCPNAAPRRTMIPTAVTTLTFPISGSLNGCANHSHPPAPGSAFWGARSLPPALDSFHPRPCRASPLLIGHPAPVPRRPP